MEQSKQCQCCGGFLVNESCPNCAVSTGARKSPWLRLATAVAVAGTAVTLAACDSIFVGGYLDSQAKGALAVGAWDSRQCQCQLCEYYRPRVPKYLAKNEERAAKKAAESKEKSERAAKKKAKK